MLQISLSNAVHSKISILSLTGGLDRGHISYDSNHQTAGIIRKTQAGCIVLLLQHII